MCCCCRCVVANNEGTFDPSGLSWHLAEGTNKTNMDGKLVLGTNVLDTQRITCNLTGSQLWKSISGNMGVDLRANKLFAEGSTGVKGWSYPPGQAVIKEGMNKVWHADSMLQSGEHCCHVLYKPKQASRHPAARYSPWCSP